MLHCQNNNKGHYHLTLEEAQKCWGTTILYVSNIPMPSSGSLVPPPSTRGTLADPAAPWRAKPVKEETQIPTVRRLGGSVKKARQMNRGQCSDYIDGLKNGLIAPEPDPEENRPVSAPPIPVSAPPIPVSAPPVVAPPPAPLTPQQEWVAKNSTKILTPLLSRVPDGYYAVQLDEKSEMHFLRMVRPKTGKHQGCTKIQKMYGTGPGAEGYRLEDAFILWPSGRVSVYKVSLEDPINLLIANHKAASQLFAKEKKRCLICNAALSDPVSRKYGLGTECITTEYGQRIVAEVDEQLALAAAE